MPPNLLIILYLPNVSIQLGHRQVVFVIYHSLLNFIISSSSSSSGSDRLCGLGVRVFGYRSGGPGSIPGTIKKYYWVWNGVHSAS
jgi:hypothetical protein